MNRIKIFYLFAIVVFITNCHSIDSSSSPELHITFKVDSTKVYNAEDIPKNIFMFSPLGHNNKIWTINTTNPYELDLITGKWSPLNMRFGNVFKRQIREDGIWKDGITGEIYISCFHDGLIRSYPEKDTFDFLKIHPVTSFHPRKKNIALGTANGLYFLNRNENNISVAENFPLDIWVNSIQESNNDTLLINYKYYYHITSNTYGEKILINRNLKKTHTINLYLEESRVNYHLMVLGSVNFITIV